MVSSTIEWKNLMTENVIREDRINTLRHLARDLMDPLFANDNDTINRGAVSSDRPAAPLRRALYA